MFFDDVWNNAFCDVVEDDKGGVGNADEDYYENKAVLREEGEVEEIP